MESLGSGAGGIQWNSTSKYIQLLSSDGSTWVNWKYYDPTRSFEIVASNTGTGELSYTCEYNGYYAAVEVRPHWSSGYVSITSTGTELLSSGAGTTYPAFIFNCTVGQTITIGDMNNNSNQALGIIIYIGSGYSGVSLLNSDNHNAAGTYSNSISTVNGLMIGRRVNYNVATDNTSVITSESDNYKSLYMVNSTNTNYYPAITAILSSQTETITLTQKINNNGSTYSRSTIDTFQLL